MDQKLVPAEKNSTDISAASAAFCISVKKKKLDQRASDPTKKVHLESISIARNDPSPEPNIYPTLTTGCVHLHKRIRCDQYDFVLKTFPKLPS